MKKHFCILEQGRSINDPLTKKNREIFTTSFSDFYRLNWDQSNDPNASFYEPGIVWSEGRSVLYERVPKTYDYYVFIDDDIDFRPRNGKDPAQELSNLLHEYQPIAGTLSSSSCWSIPDTITRRDYLDAPSFPVAGHDLQVQICSMDFADLVFPVWRHGANQCLWYSQWICHQLLPRKQIWFNEIQVLNTRSNEHYSEGRSQHVEGNQIIWEFNRGVIPPAPPLEGSIDSIRRKNSQLFESSPDRNHARIELAALDKIFDLSSPLFRNRSSIAPQHHNSTKAIRSIPYYLSNPGAALLRLKRLMAAGNKS